MHYFYAIVHRLHIWMAFWIKLQKKITKMFLFDAQITKKI